MSAEASAAEAPEVVGDFPLTPMQARFWFLARLSPDSVSSNVAVHWELRGRVRAESVRAAFERVVARHEILRTRFVESDGTARQQVLARAPFQLGTVDVRNLPEADRAARIAEIARGVAQEPFDLGAPSLLRAMLVRVSPERALLLIGAHHIVFDGWSIRVLGREVGAAIAEIEGHPQPPLPALDLQYADYALWHEEMMAGPEAEAAVEWWRARLAGAPYFELPSDRPRAPLGKG